MKYRDYIYAFETVYDYVEIDKKTSKSNLVFIFILMLVLSFMMQMIILAEFGSEILLPIYIIYIFVLLVIYVGGRIYINCNTLDVPKSKRPGQLMMAATGLLVFFDTIGILIKLNSTKIMLYVFIVCGFLIMSTLIFGFLIQQKAYRMGNYKRLSYLKSLPALVLVSQPIAAYFNMKTDVIFNNSKEWKVMIALNILSAIFLLAVPNLLTWIMYAKFDEKDLYETRCEKLKMFEETVERPDK